jgi:CRISPR system Cascade subunit CasA
MSKYNLIDEKWIPVRDLAGNRKEIGILETLIDAEHISVVEDPSPLVTAALHRFLLAVLYRALEGPCDIDEAKKYFKEGLPKDKIRRYLEKLWSRFFIFDEKYPFGQIPNFTPKTWRSWTAIAAEHNADNAKVLFDHMDVSASGSISCAAAARWLLATQTFAVSTGKSELSHTGTSPSAGAIMAIPIGRTLEDTLFFCLVPQNREIMQSDLPFWEKEPESLEYLKNAIKVRDKKTGKEKARAVERKAIGIVDVYSWRGRSVRFKNNNTDRITCIAFASGVGYDENSGVIDPMLAYSIVDVKDQGTKETTKKKVTVHLGARGIWRDFDSLLPDDTQLAPTVIDNMIALTRSFPEKMADSVMVLGQKYYPPRPNIAFWRMERFTLPKAMRSDRYIRGEIHSYLEEAEDGNKSLYSACANYAQALLSRGDRKPEKNDVSNFIEQMPSLPHYWSILETKFHEILREYTLARNPDDIHHDWLVAVRDALAAAWKLHQNSVAGGDAWAIRAMVKADAIIERIKVELSRDIQSLKGEVIV